MQLEDQILKLEKRLEVEESVYERLLFPPQDRVKYKLHLCPQADKEHAKNSRQYAHTFHLKNKICLAEAFTRLSYLHQAGILLHELGHLAYPTVEDEEEIDDRIHMLSGVQIYRTTNKYLETILGLDAPRAEKYIRRYIEIH